MSQRTEGFHGGIQAGTTACSAESTGLEHVLRASVSSVAATSSATWRSGYSGSELAGLLGLDDVVLNGTSPDGGVWMSGEGDVPLVVAEAKKQGATGNAIERWFKNYLVFKTLGVEVYVTVCTGEGFFNGNSAQKILETAVACDPSERHRLNDGTVWNQPVGSLWFYRFASAAEADAADLPGVLSFALAEATRRRAERA